MGIEEAWQGQLEEKCSEPTNIKVITCIVFHVRIVICVLYILICFLSQQPPFSRLRGGKKRKKESLSSEKLNNLPQVSQLVDGSARM